MAFAHEWARGFVRTDARQRTGEKFDFIGVRRCAQERCASYARYERLLANGKTKKQAIVACMRKLLHLMVGVLKSKKLFDPNMNSAKTA